ncbi:origin recognition complex subunit 2, partial [Asbolus verrucosus]
MEDAFEKQCTITPRRGQRQRKLSLKGIEYVSRTPRLSKTNVQRRSTSESESEECTGRVKPMVLHDNDILCGGKIFTFQTRKKCEAIINKTQAKPQNVPKTPHALRTKMKKSNIAAKVLDENDSSDKDFSDSGSEYVASDEEAETESTSSESDCSEATNKAQLVTTSKQIQTSKRQDKSYTIKTDDYFSNHSSKKIQTSNHTLDKLETPRLPQAQLQKLLSTVKIGRKHESAINKLTETNQSYFNKWLYLMHENVNILLYGLGSKRNVLSLFHEKCLKKLPTIVINGFFPSLTIKDVLDSIILDLLELKENPANIYEACELVEREFSYILDTHLYLIVHNIDLMRNSKAQNIFARLAAVKNIHLIASIDHINAPLIWDHSKLSKFNFTWWDVTTFETYIDETSFESSMMVQRTGTLALSSLRNVFLSLTSNSKGIYLILVKYQIENSKKQYYQGLAFRDLYSSCREQFLVSSDLALRAQLTEFVDHKM